MGFNNGTYSPAFCPCSRPVPLVGGITYVRTGVLKWWLGGVLMGGAYMVCGKRAASKESNWQQQRR